MRALLIAASLALASLSAHAANQAVLTWTYDLVAWPSATFNVYQGEKGQPKTQAQTGVAALTTTISTGLATGKTYCWDVTAVVGGFETDHSAEACKPFPPSPTLTVK